MTRSTLRLGGRLVIVLQASSENESLGNDLNRWFSEHEVLGALANGEWRD